MEAEFSGGKKGEVKQDRMSDMFQHIKLQCKLLILWSFLKSIEHVFKCIKHCQQDSAVTYQLAQTRLLLKCPLYFEGSVRLPMSTALPKFLDVPLRISLRNNEKGIRRHHEGENGCLLVFRQGSCTCRKKLVKRIKVVEKNNSTDYGMFRIFPSSRHM